MAIIEFMRDTNGEKQVLNVLLDLEKLAKENKDYAQLYVLIIRGFEFLETHGIPKGSKEIFAKLEKEDASPYTIRLIKKLKYHPPLYEFRINWRGAGAFRSVLFEFEYTNEQVIMFIKATIKEQTSSSEFEKIIAESKDMFTDFQQNPKKYLEGADEDE